MNLPIQRTSDLTQMNRLRRWVSPEMHLAIPEVPDSHADEKIIPAADIIPSRTRTFRRYTSACCSLSGSRSYRRANRRLAKDPHDRVTVEAG
jgi:hypothetical protein